MRTVLDTNVLIAALITRGVCADLLQHCVIDHTIVSSDFILNELREKLVQKFKYTDEEADDAVTLLRSQMEIVDPQPLDNPVCRDADDDWILATAVTDTAKCIVTGDKDLLTIQQYDGTPSSPPQTSQTTRQPEPFSGNRPAHHSPLTRTPPMNPACNSSAHLPRRAFLGGSLTGALGMAGFHGMVEAAAAKKLASQQKRAVVFWLGGGVSQLETWDPKPGTDNGGPFRAIPTSAPGVQICELLPHTAKVMHHLALVRGINTKENNHAKGAVIMQYGRPRRPGFDFPHLGSAFSSLLSKPGNPLPGYISIGRGGNAKEAAFLGPRHAPVVLKEGNAPNNLNLPAGVTQTDDQRRRALRERISRRFSLGRRGADTEVYNQSYDQAAALMARKDLFDFSRFSAKDVERYGKHEFGRHCLMARRLVEEGVTFTKVEHRNYDTHSENFNFHIEQLGEFDRPFATFVGDLADRGLLRHTLVIVMCEFGRTPRINAKMGRDHWGTAWSIALGGSGIKGGAVVGKTNANGTKVTDREVNGGHLFHTYYQAVGIDSKEDFWHNGRPFEKAPKEAAAIREVLG